MSSKDLLDPTNPDVAVMMQLFDQFDNNKD